MKRNRVAEIPMSRQNQKVCIGNFAAILLAQAPSFVRFHLAAHKLTFLDLPRFSKKTNFEAPAEKGMGAIILLKVTIVGRFSRKEDIIKSEFRRKLSFFFFIKKKWCNCDSFCCHVFASRKMLRHTVF